MKETILSIVMVLVPMILSLAVHEWAHAFTAYKLGDDTAARQGRLTLSPEKHIDILGSIVFPIIGVFMGFIFGWAKPVPFVPANFTRKVSMKTGTLLVAIAGPVSNLVLAIACGIALKLMVIFGGEAFLTSDYGEPIARLVGAGLHLNVILCFFNFVPVPPLDGSKILYGVLPHRLDYIVEFLERYQWFVFIGFLFLGVGILAEYVIYPMLGLLVVILGLEPVIGYISFQPVF